ncbi:putative High choriolytic enzyme 1 [Hypsibius exemplaris]|uniref:Metalloendopeptidase n=1 Tax=Hypsibius exemplaris TaxID=2072580 RepID=A0A1W0WIS9_HYPEX|nr:putative High choriolytic enzyme 1 [Hypsibius exemplaris]
MNTLPDDWRDYVPQGSPSTSQPMLSNLFEGDIFIPPVRATPEGVFLSAMVGPDVKWPDRTVFVDIASHFSDEERNVIVGAMRYLESNTCIRFVNRTDQHDYINITGNLPGCWSYMGRYGGMQLLSLQRHGCVYHGHAVHELMHALGFHHEQSRSDRDEHVIINWSNIQPGSHQEQFKLRNTNNLNLSYDYGSIMHYAVKDFAMDQDFPALIPKAKGVYAKIGQRDGLSPLDIQRLNLFYECENTSFVEVPVSTTTATTTFLPDTTTDVETTTPYSVDTTTNVEETTTVSVETTTELSTITAATTETPTTITSAQTLLDTTTVTSLPDSTPCLKDEEEKSSVTCTDDETFCNATQACYDTATEVCCEAEQKPCGKTCYDPRLNWCYEGGLLCPHGELPCGNGTEKPYECYHSGQKKCYDGSILCPHDEKPCDGGKVCYNSTRNGCFPGGIVCDLGLTSCDGSACYNLSDSWCYTGGIVCPHSKLPCGRTCYEKDKFWCYEGEIICPHGQEPCGGICYDLKTSVCRKGKLEAKPVDVAVCPPGEKICGGGTSCYNSSQSTCYSSGVVCSHNETLCGPDFRTCYAKDRYWCYTGGIVCLHGQQPCNGICFYTNTSVCRNGKVELKVCDGNYTSGCGCDHGFCYKFKTIPGVANEPWCWTQQLGVAEPQAKFASCTNHGQCSVQMTCGDGVEHRGGAVNIPGGTMKATPSSLRSSSRGQKKKCASNQTFCKATQSCYNTTTEECCTKGERSCGKTCYNPQNSLCYEGGFVCRHGELPCGNGIGKAYNCYNSSRSWCYQGGTVCPHGEKPCRGGKSCYNSTRSKCFSSGVVCPLGLNSCDGSACYNLSDSWCYTGGVVCPHAELPCGRSCYAKDRFWCYEGGIICPHGQQPCGRICYDSKTSVCRRGKVEAKSNGCDGSYDKGCGCDHGFCYKFKTIPGVAYEPWCWTQQLGVAEPQAKFASCTNHNYCSV